MHNTKTSTRARLIHWSKRLNPAVSIFSSSKSFTDPWLASYRLNQWGLHGMRLSLADQLFRFRNLQRAKSNRWPRLQNLRRDGYIVIEDFLPQIAFTALRDESEKRLETSLQRNPITNQQGQPGFGPKQPIENGFDRYDGDTLNRFLEIKASHSPEATRFVEDERLLALCDAAVTRPVTPNQFSLYHTRNGQNHYPDIQKALHRDTFHHAIKCWFFLRDVDEKQGPFVYVPGSHKLTPARLTWERARSLSATKPGAQCHSSSFRIHNDELTSMGYGQPRSFPAKANTLIMADTLGFHRRGNAEAGSERLAIYGAFRPWPFHPFAY